MGATSLHKRSLSNNEKSIPIGKEMSTCLIQSKQQKKSHVLENSTYVVRRGKNPENSFLFISVAITYWKHGCLEIIIVVPLLLPHFFTRRLRHGIGTFSSQISEE